MIKIVFLIRSLDIGGAERQLVNLAKSLNQKYFDVTILEFYSGGFLEKEVKENNIHLISLNKKKRWDTIAFIKNLIHQINAIKPDVVHGYLGTANILTILIKLFNPKIPVIWGVRASNMDYKQYDWLSRLVFKLECLMSRCADLIIVNSNAGYQHHTEAGFPIKKMVVIPNGINTQRFYPDLEARARVRKEWNIPDDTIVIGLVGRLDPMKGHPTFLKAAQIFLDLNSQQENIKFVCVGSGIESYTQKLHELSNQLNLTQHLLWVAQRSDLEAVYNAIDIISSSSSYGEGFSNVIGEAMACGIPCVVTDVGDSAFIVGNKGIVVPSKNPHALAEAWNQKLVEGSEKDRELARERILNHFSLEQLITQTSSSISELLLDSSSKTKSLRSKKILDKS